jgi:hypothetical protein
MGNEWALHLVGHAGDIYRLNSDNGGTVIIRAPDNLPSTVIIALPNATTVSQHELSVGFACDVCFVHAVQGRSYMRVSALGFNTS